MRARILSLSAIALIIGLMLIVQPPLFVGHAELQGTPFPEVYAEALGQANLRGGPGVDYPIVGQITSGTRYRVLAQHTLVPWLRIDFPGAAQAWVYTDLVSLTGSLSLVPSVNDFAYVTTQIPPTHDPAAVGSPTVTVQPPTLTPTLVGAVATTIGEGNVRYGPGLEYPIIVEVPAGSSFRIMERHAIVPWVRIELPDSPTGSGWIYNEVIEVSGDIYSVPVTENLQFDLPDLTPTPQIVLANGAPWDGAPVASGQLANTLGQQVYTYLTAQGFIPFTHKFGSVFVMDLKTGDRFTINGGIAFSGMSLTKIGILITYFARHEGPFTDDEAYLVADTMMCSENITTNRLLDQIGDGDMLRGAQRVTAALQTLNMRGTFITRQYVVSDDDPPVHAETIHTSVDQVSAKPDLYNEVLPEDLGWLLGGIYQCALDGTGLLMDRLPDKFTVQECRQMLAAMDSNVINVFTEAGVPVGTRVIHKHGWISDTHGDAALVIGSKGAYVFVVTLYQDDYLEFKDSSVIIAELSRMVWNYFNPENPVEASREGTVPGTCDPYADPVYSQLLSVNLPAPTP